MILGIYEDNNLHRTCIRKPSPNLADSNSSLNLENKIGIMPFDENFDVVVVGGGNAGFSAATTAAQLGSRVLLVEKAPQADAGGNTFFTAGAYRTCFGGLNDLLPILYQQDGTKGLPKGLAEKIDMDAYTPADFHADIKRVCKGRSDPDLANLLVNGSREAVQWIADLGGKWALSFNRQAFEVDGRFRFWGGMVMAFLGKHISRSLHKLIIADVCG